MPELERPSPQDYDLNEPALDHRPIARTDWTAAGLDRPNRKCHLGESWSADLEWALGVVVSGGTIIPFLPRLAIALGFLVAAAFFWQIV